MARHPISSLWTKVYRNRGDLDIEMNFCDFLTFDGGYRFLNETPWNQGNAFEFELSLIRLDDEVIHLMVSLDAKETQRLRNPLGRGCQLGKGILPSSHAARYLGRARRPLRKTEAEDRKLLLHMARKKSLIGSFATRLALLRLKFPPS